MCWATCDKLAKIAETQNLPERVQYWNDRAQEIHEQIMSHAWNSQLNSLTSTWGGDEVDAYLLRLPRLGFIHPKEPKFLSTLQLIEQRLKRNNFILCSERDITSLNAATFWYINILADVGRMADARQVFSNILKVLNHNGLLSETVDYETGELWGNFPHHNAMVGLILAAFKLSKPWESSF